MKNYCQLWTYYLNLRSYYRRFTDKVIQTKDSRLYYQVINRLKTTEKSKSFSVADLFPSKPLEEIAEAVADFYTNIAKDFRPLQTDEFPQHTPTSSDEPILQVTDEQVEDRLRECKKPEDCCLAIFFRIF